jgi:hypothetical protein
MAKTMQVAVKTEIKFINRPALFMSANEKAPVAKVIVFGAVDVGKMNANDAPMPVGMTYNKGLRSLAVARPAVIGTSSVAAPAFDTNSVNTETINITNTH